MDSQLHACKSNIHLDIAIKAAHEGEYFESDDIHTIMIWNEKHHLQGAAAPCKRIIRHLIINNSWS
jgi:hypothetical protein